MSETASLAVAWVSAGGLAAVAVIGIAGTSIKMSAEARRQRREQRFKLYGAFLKACDEWLLECGSTWSGEADAEDLANTRLSEMDVDQGTYARVEREALEARSSVLLIGTKSVATDAIKLFGRMRSLMTFTATDNSNVEELRTLQTAYSEQRFTYLNRCRKDLKPARIWR